MRLSNHIPRLPDAEFAVMTAIWENPSPVTTTQLLTLINADREEEWALSTLQTLLTRLVKRGFLFSEKQGKIRCYSPKIAQAEYRKSEMQDFLDKHYHCSAFELAKALISMGRLTPEELQKCRELFLKEE